MTHDKLVEKSIKWLKKKGCGVYLADPFHSPLTRERPDAIGWRDGLSLMVEAKASRADFLQDKKKGFRIDPSEGMGDWRFFICPEGMIKPEELPRGWGLLYLSCDAVIEVHGVPNNCHYHTKKPFDGNKKAESILLVAALRKLFQHQDDIYKKKEADFTVYSKEPCTQVYGQQS